MNIILINLIFAVALQNSKTKFAIEINAIIVENAKKTKA